jgi:hypothetical protein
MANSDPSRWPGIVPQSTPDDYFSDRENGPVPRTSELISKEVWEGLAGLIENSIERGCFGERFPETCPDGVGVIGTNARAFASRVRVEIPGLVWPPEREDPSSWDAPKPTIPSTLHILDLLEFCFREIASPVPADHHSYYAHYHLRFDAPTGRQEFRNDANRILSRNGLAFELGSDGKVRRLAPLILRESLGQAVFRSGDSTLDTMLEESRRKFLNPDPRLRKEAVERLWDSWERLKTLGNPKDKKASIEQLLRRAAPEALLFEKLNEEATALTAIGNQFHIRHSEVGKVAVDDSRHIDYLFHRLFALIQLILGSLGRNVEGQA